MGKKNTTPAWLTSHTGILDTVPRPWTPVAAQDGRLSCWGRTYACGDHLLPAQVASRGKTMLARPMGLEIVCGGQPLRLTPCRTAPVERQVNGRFVRRHAVGRAGDLLLTSTVTLHYDGAMRVDLRVAPLRPVTVDSLAVTLPVRFDQAEWVLARVGPGVATNDLMIESQNIPASGWTGPFHPMPYVWMGNEARGLAWFCESDQHWDAGADALRLARDGDAVVFSARIIRAPRPIAEPLDVSFGLLANPWRPPEPGCRQFHNYHHNWLYDHTDADLERLAAQGVRTLIFHEDWSDLHAYPDTAYEKRLKSLVKRCHAHGLKLLVYLENQMSSGAPEWPEWGESRWRILPKQVRGYTPLRGPPHPAFLVCFRGEWVDFTMYKVERLLRTYDLDGVYLDGWPAWRGCHNALHGCGYAAPDGTRRPTYNLWECREALERMYAVVKAFKKDGRVSLHGNPGAGIGAHFGTDCFGGEQYGGDYTRCGLFRLRALHLGEASWGVFSELISYANHNYNMAVGLLHNVLPRPWHANQVPCFSVWKARDAFGADRADERPYWKNAGVVGGQTESVKASLWNRRGVGMLLVVSNLGKEPTTAELAFSGTLGLRGEWAALDLLPAERMNWDEDRLALALPETPAARAGHGTLAVTVPAGQARLLFVASPDSRLWPSMRACRVWIEEQIAWQNEQFDRMRDEAGDEWLVAGPFGDESDTCQALGQAKRPVVPPEYRGLETAYAPESEPFDPASAFVVAGGRTQGWLKLKARNGEVTLRPEVVRARWAIVYLRTRVNFPTLLPSREDNPVDLHLHTCHACKLWINGKPVYTHGGAGTPRYGQRGYSVEDSVPAVLRPGWNTVVVKLVVRENTRFSMRITGRGGESVPPLLVRAVDGP